MVKLHNLYIRACPGGWDFSAAHVGIYMFCWERAYKFWDVVLSRVFVFCFLVIFWTYAVCTLSDDKRANDK